MRPVTINANQGGAERTLLFVAHRYINEEHDALSTGKRVWQRQVGWLGHDGQVYALDEEAQAKHGGEQQRPVPYGPLYIDIGD